MEAPHRLLVSSANPQKLDFLLELLRHLPEVEVEVLPQATAEVGDDPEADFWSMAGTWQPGRPTAEELRQRSWQRDMPA